MWLLAGIASFLFPGAGPALIGKLRLAVIWAIAGAVPFLVLMVWAPASAIVLVIRAAAAVDAVVRAWRAGKVRPDYERAGLVIGAQVVYLVILNLWVVQLVRVPTTSMVPTLQIGDHVIVRKVFADPGRGDVVVFHHPTGHDFIKRVVALGGDRVAVRQGILYVNSKATPQRRIGPAGYHDYDDMTDQWSAKEADRYEESLGGHTYSIFRDRDTTRHVHDYPAEKDAAFSAEGDPCNPYDIQDPAYRRNAMRATADRTECEVPAGMVFMLGDNRDNANDSRSSGAIPTEQIVGRVVGIWMSRNGHDGWQLSRIGNVD